MRQSPAPADFQVPAIAPGQPSQVYYVLGESPCPYLPARRERKIVTEIPATGADDRYALLSRAGFRRSHNFAYRPACSGCAACVPVRVPVGEFAPGASLRRVERRNVDLRGEYKPARATAEQYALFARYIGSRHGDGEMAGMSFADYRGMIEQTRIDTRITEYRDHEGKLVAACLADWLDDGPSAVYSFFAPEAARRSLGSYMILWLIAEARAAGLPYAYLGYWIARSPKMAYKTRFRPLEGFGTGGWRRLDPSD